MVKPHTAYYPHGLTDRMSNRNVNNILEACALKYENHQWIAWHGKKSRLSEPPSVKSADNIIKVHTPLYWPREIFGTNLILKKVEPVQMIQKLLR